MGSLGKMQTSPTSQETSSQPLISDGAPGYTFYFLHCHSHCPEGSLLRSHGTGEVWTVAVARQRGTWPLPAPAAR